MDDTTVYANMFIGNVARIPWKNDTLVIREKTGYPWKGEVSFTLEKPESEQFVFAIRIPGWSKNTPVPGGLYNYENNVPSTVKVVINRQVVNSINDKDGYLRINRKWKSGDQIDVKFDMPVRQVVAVSEVKEDSGYIAIIRGPVVYCLESKDNPDNVFDITLRGNEQFTPEPLDSLLPGIFTLKGIGRYRDSHKIPVTLIPYFLWNNRGKGDMTVWIPGNWTKKTEERQLKNSKGNSKKGNTDG